MNILIMLPNLGKGGAEEVIINLASHLSVENNVTLLLMQKIEEDTYNIEKVNSNVNIIYLFSTNQKFLSKFSRVKRILWYLNTPLLSLYVFLKLRLWTYDYIHINLTWPRILAPWLKVFSVFFFTKKNTFVETFHSNWDLLSLGQKIVCSISWSFVDKVICEIGNKEVSNVRKFSLNRDVIFIPIAVEEAKKKDDIFLAKFRKERNICRENVFTIGTIARLKNDIKRFDLILKAIKIFKDRGYSKFKYFIFGDGPDRELIQRMIYDLDLSENVNVFGFVDNPTQIVHLLDVFVVAMVEEFTGIAGLQAGKAGIPIIGVQTDSTYKYSVNHIWSSNDPKSICQKIIELTSSEYRDFYLKNTIQKVVERHSITKFFDEYSSVFSER